MRFPFPSQTELPASTLLLKQEEERVREDQTVPFLKTSSLCSYWRVQHFDPHFQDLPAFDRERWQKVGPASFTHRHARENLRQWCANSFLAGLWGAKQHLSQPVYHILAHFSHSWQLSSEEPRCSCRSLSQGESLHSNEIVIDASLPSHEPAHLSLKMVVPLFTWLELPKAIKNIVLFMWQPQKDSPVVSREGVGVNPDVW